MATTWSPEFESALDVFVLEDDGADAELIRLLLGQAVSGDLSVTVYEKLVALERGLSTSKPDVVLCDLSVPDASGMEVVTRAVGAAGSAPVVILTGSADSTIPLRALAAGAQDYIPKAAMGAESLGRAMRFAVARNLAEAETRRLASELQIMNRDLDHFAGIVAHDLRSPIRTARLLADRTLAGLAGTLHPAIDSLTTQMEVLDRAEAMIAALLDLARLRDVAVGHEPIQLGDLVADVVDDLASDIAQAHGSVELMSDALLAGDRVLLHDVLANLIRNSLKYSHDARPPAVTISGQRDEDRVVVTVSDNGIGIDPGQRHRVFGLFERLQVKDGVAGLGFGLAFCHRVARLHGGSIAVVDPADGVGTSVRLELPAAEARSGGT
jgi:signal transduction histidine kinase